VAVEPVGLVAVEPSPWWPSSGRRGGRRAVAVDLVGPVAVELVGAVAVEPVAAVAVEPVGAAVLGRTISMQSNVT
jgi:hypothetical protein